MNSAPPADGATASTPHALRAANACDEAALIVAPSWIGDTLMAHTLFQRLKQDCPQQRLDVLAPPWVSPVLARMPEIGNIIDNPFAHGELALAARYRLARRLAAGGYRRAYILPNSLKSALIPFLAGISERIGFTGEARYGLLNYRHTLDKDQLPLMVERFAQLAEAPGAPLRRPYPLPRLCSSPEQQAETLGRLGLDIAAPVTVFCPGAEYGPAKRWPTAHFAALADALAERGQAVWILGSAKDRAIGEEIRERCRQCRPSNLCGSTSLTQAIDLIASARTVVCNDSGLMHVAAALNRPLIALFGSSSPGFTPPLSERARIIHLGLRCSPCFKRECPLGHFDCMNTLEPQRVLAACLDGDNCAPHTEQP